VFGVRWKGRRFLPPFHRYLVHPSVQGELGPDFTTLGAKVFLVGHVETSQPFMRLNYITLILFPSSTTALLDYFRRFPPMMAGRSGTTIRQ
jgi:hypothetical protein